MVAEISAKPDFSRPIDRNPGSRSVIAEIRGGVTLIGEKPSPLHFHVAENVRTVQNQTPLLAAIGCGILWQQWLDEGLFANVSELAKHLGKERSFVSHMLQLALLSPEIIHLAIIGALPEHISLATLRVGLPADWEEQKKVLGIE